MPLLRQENKHLSERAAKNAELKDTCEVILAGNSRLEWNPAYIILRREAQEALQYAHAGAATPAV
jgi:hypothetical protein